MPLSRGSRALAGLGLLACLIVAGCGAMPDRYLSRNLDNVTEDEVVDMMGEPTERGHVLDGREEWMYRQYLGARHTEPMPIEHGDCAQYRLIFDERQVLREWNKEECS